MTVTMGIRGVDASNKAAKSTIKLDERAYRYRVSGKPTIHISMPMIDKISIVLAVPNEEWQKEIVYDLRFGLKDVTNQVIRSPKGSSKKYYREAAYIFPPNTEHGILVQASPRKETNKFLRLEFNPHKMGRRNVKWALSYLQYAFAPHALLWKNLIETGVVTRVDAACDLVNVQIGDLLLSQSAMHKPHSYHGLEGAPETVYLGSKPNEAGNLGSADKKVYDKAQQLNDSGHKAQFGQLRHTRVEITYKASNKLLANLNTLKNPFKRIEISYPQQGVAPDEPYVWQLFLDSCRHRGLKGALSLLPEKLQDEYEEALGAVNGEPFWRPDEIWEHWTTVVADSGIFDVGKHHEE